MESEESRHTSGEIINVVSYPKSGKGWLRFLLVEALNQHYELGIDTSQTHPSELAERFSLPLIELTHDGDVHNKLPEEIQFNEKQYRDRKVIFLTRDPRDIVVSFFFHQSRRATNYSGALKDFVYEPRGGIDSIITFYNSWAENFQLADDFLLLRYEDLQENPEDELLRALQFIGLQQVKPSSLEAAVQYSGFENMKKIELSNIGSGKRLQPGSANDPESFKARKGKVGGYKDYLEVKEIEYLTEKLQGLHEMFQYPYPGASAT